MEKWITPCVQKDAEKRLRWIIRGGYMGGWKRWQKRGRLGVQSVESFCSIAGSERQRKKEDEKNRSF